MCQEWREKTAAARESYDAWCKKKEEGKLRKKLDQTELELEEASYRTLARPRLSESATGAI